MAQLITSPFLFNKWNAAIFVRFLTDTDTPMLLYATTHLPVCSNTLKLMIKLAPVEYSNGNIQNIQKMQKF